MRFEQETGTWRFTVYQNGTIWQWLCVYSRVVDGRLFKLQPQDLHGDRAGATPAEKNAWLCKLKVTIIRGHKESNIHKDSCNRECHK